MGNPPYHNATLGNPADRKQCKEKTYLLNSTRGNYSNDWVDWLATVIDMSLKFKTFQFSE